MNHTLPVSLSFLPWGKIIDTGDLDARPSPAWAASFNCQVTRLPSACEQTNCLPSICQHMDLSTEAVCTNLEEKKENKKIVKWKQEKIVVKFETLWEGHKIWKKIPSVLTKQLFFLSSVKTSGRFFQIFVAFSEKLDFTTKYHSYQKWWIKFSSK